jgi:cyanophycin synthetase
MTKKKDIKFLRVSHLRGPNIWTYRPVIEVWLDIGELEDCPSNTIPGLYERLTTWLPGLVEHRCGVGTRGGFLERLQEGTWAGHILEHVALELQNMAGMKTGFGKTRGVGQPGIYKMAFRTREEAVGRAALESGRELLLAAINDESFDITTSVKKLTELVDRRCLGPSTAHIVDAAIERRIPHIRLTEGNLVQLGYGSAQRRIWTAETDRTGAIAEGIASDKDLTKTLIASCGVPVPEGEVVRSADEAWEAAQDIGTPVVIKPIDGNHGRGVMLNLRLEKYIRESYEIAAKEGGSSAVLVERYIPGNEHRLLVVGSKVVAAARGESLFVTGDGKSDIIELCNSQINTDPRRGNTEEHPLNTVEPHESEEILLDLRRQGLTPQSVPQEGQKVLIQLNGNVADDVTDLVHPEVAHAAALAARVVGLDIAGIDLVCEDISRPLDEQRGAIIEVNASPGLLAHIKPASGTARNVGKAIVDHLFAEGETGRIPVVGVTGTLGTSLISRLVGCLVHLTGKHVGVANGEGLYLDQRQVTAGDCMKFEAGERVLINRWVQAAVFESNARTILTQGLAYDRCDVGVVTDMQAGDLSDLHINDQQALANVVRSQVDVILPEGTAVLNAADPEVVALAELCDGGVMYYALDENNEVMAGHRANGGKVAFVRDGRIILARGSDETPLLELSKIKPATAKHPESLLAAACAAWAMEVPADLICAGLRTFDATPKKTNAK